MSDYDMELVHILSRNGWTFEEHKEGGPGYTQTIPRWKKGENFLAVSSLQLILSDHPWCRGDLHRALRNGAIGFSAMTSDPDEQGRRTATFTPWWPDAVTRLGKVAE